MQRYALANVPTVHLNFCLNKDHPNIVRLEEVYESHSEIYLVQEVCKGGELFDRLDEQPDYHVSKSSYRGCLM